MVQYNDSEPIWIGLGAEKGRDTGARHGLMWRFYYYRQEKSCPAWSHKVTLFHGNTSNSASAHAWWSLRNRPRHAIITGRKYLPRTAPYKMYQAYKFTAPPRLRPQNSYTITMRARTRYPSPHSANESPFIIYMKAHEIVRVDYLQIDYPATHQWVKWKYFLIYPDSKNKLSP